MFHERAFVVLIVPAGTSYTDTRSILRIVFGNVLTAARFLQKFRFRHNVMACSGRITTELLVILLCDRLTLLLLATLLAALPLVVHHLRRITFLFEVILL